MMILDLMNQHLSLKMLKPLIQKQEVMNSEGLYRYFK
jgi:hypothetical protein